DRETPRRAARIARGRPGAGTQSHRHHRALPSRAGRRRQDGRFLGLGRRRHQATHPRDRGRRGIVGRAAVRASPLAMAASGFRPSSAAAHLRTADPALAAVIDAIGPFGMQLKASRSVFGALAEAIVYQQLSNKAAATIYARIEALYPRARDGFTP